MQSKAKWIAITAAAIVAVAVVWIFWFAKPTDSEKSSSNRMKEMLAAVAPKLDSKIFYSPEAPYKADISFFTRSKATDGLQKTLQIEMSCEISTVKDSYGKLWLKVKPLTVTGQGQDGDKKTAYNSAAGDADDPSKDMFARMMTECVFCIESGESNVRLHQGNEIATIVLEQLGNLSTYFATADQMQTGKWQIKRNDFRFGIERGIAEQADCEIRFCSDDRVEIYINGQGENGENKFTNTGMILLNHKTGTLEQANFRFNMKYADGRELSADMQARFTVDQQPRLTSETELPPSTNEPTSAPGKNNPNRVAACSVGRGSSRRLMILYRLAYLCFVEVDIASASFAGVDSPSTMDRSSITMRLSVSA